MIVYTVIATCPWEDDIYVDGITDSDEAEETARGWAKKFEGERNVFIEFGNTEDPNNYGYLNWDGHSPNGIAW